MRFGLVFAVLVGVAPIARADAVTPTGADTLLLAADAEPSSRAAASADGSSLGASWEKPWNPDGPVSRRRGWEQAILLPGRIATLPLTGIGIVANHTLLYLEESMLLTKVSFVAKQLPERAGFSIKPASLGSRTGLGGNIALHTPFLGGALKNRLRADFTMTTREYTRSLLTVSGHPATLQYGYEWRPQDRFYGLGLESSESNRSDYAAQREFVRGAFEWGWNADAENQPPHSKVDVWGGPRTIVTRTGRESGTVSWDDRFPDLGALTLDRRVDHLIYGGSFMSDWRYGDQRWIGGWRVRLAAERYDRPRQRFALRSGEPAGAQFTRYDVETETGVSFMRDPRTLRVLVRMTNQEVSSGREFFMNSDLATLGGRVGLAGYDPGRFHDLDLLLGKVSYIIPLVRRLELDLHTEWGGVYGDVWDDPKWSTLRSSYGVALRGRLKDKPFGAVGVDFSREAVRLRFSLTGVE